MINGNTQLRSNYKMTIMLLMMIDDDGGGDLNVDYYVNNDKDSDNKDNKRPC